MSGQRVRLATRLGALGIAMIMGAGLAGGTALADPVPTTTTSPPTTTTTPTSPAPPTSTPTNSPPASEEPSEGADLRITAALDKERYNPGDLVRVTVTITNDGPDTAVGVTGAGTGHGAIGVVDGWGDLGFPPGITLAAGETKVVELSGHILGGIDTVFGYSVRVLSSEPVDPNPDNNFTSVTGAIVRGTFAGLIFTDRNVNGVRDPDETGLAGVTVQLLGDGFRSQTTDAQGRFSFAPIAPGHYSVYYSAPDGWTVFGVTGQGVDQLDIDTSGRYADVSIPAVRPLQESLEARIQFDSDSYQAGDTTHLTVTLFNRGTRDLTGVTARCHGYPGSPGLRGGPGWGPLFEGGVTVPAGFNKVTVVRVSEPVPEDAPRFGYVSAFCDFTAAGYPPNAQVFAEARAAQVPGAPGSGRGRVYEDRNSNGYPDTGEQLAGVTVVITDPNTGVAVARPVTDAEGAFAVENLPAGEYDLRVPGPWKPRFEFGGWFRFAVVAGDSVGEQTFGLERAPEEQNNRPNLKVSATLGKAAYNSGDIVHGRVTVTNIGEVAAEGVRANFGGGPPGLRVDNWGELQPFGPGTRVEAGATRVFDVDGFIVDADAGIVIFGNTLATANGEMNTRNNSFSVVAPVTKTFGNYAGVVFGDRNDNGQLDAGEELAGVRISLSSHVGPNALVQTTDAHGRFAFTQVPTGLYHTFATAPDEWVVTGTGTVQIDETDDPDALIRAVRPLKETLRATLTFDGGRYRLGDTVHLTVTLKNTGRKPIEHIRAWCNGIGNDNALNGDAEGWGPLQYNAEGVTVLPGRTKTIHVTDTVPAGADRAGFVEAACEFGPEQTLGLPGDLDTANIVGKTGDAHGQLVQDANGDGQFSEPVANTRVALLLPGTNCPVGFATTDAEGNFDVPGLAARHYDVKVLGPWKFADEFHFVFVNSGPFNQRWLVRLVRR